MGRVSMVYFLGMGPKDLALVRFHIIKNNNNNNNNNVFKNIDIGCLKQWYPYYFINWRINNLTIMNFLNDKDTLEHY